MSTDMIERDTESARIVAAILRNCEQYDQGAIDYAQWGLEQRRQWQRAERRHCVRAVMQRLYPSSR